MNKLLKCITALFGVSAVLLCGSCMKLTKLQEVTVETDVPPKIVFLGDSIAAGYGLDGYSQDDLYNCGSYANILGSRYGAELADKCEQTMINNAVTGDTSLQLLGHIKDGEFDEALADSDAVVISIGGNDLLDVIWRVTEKLGYDQKEHKFDIADTDVVSAVMSMVSFSSDVDAALGIFETNLNDITAAIRERTDAEIFVQTLYDPFSYIEDIKFISEFTGKKVDMFNSIVERNSEAGGVHIYTVADVGDAFKGKCGELTNIKQYDVHPNETGHNVIAGVIDSAVRSVTYSYTYTEEVTDKGAVIALIWICAVSAVLVIAAAVVTVTVIKRRKETEADDQARS